MFFQQFFVDPIRAGRRHPAEKPWPLAKAPFSVSCYINYIILQYSIIYVYSNFYTSFFRDCGLNLTTGFLYARYYRQTALRPYVRLHRTGRNSFQYLQPAFPE